ncbi:MAG: glycosyltransferase [Planctomycetota bacterium]
MRALITCYGSGGDTYPFLAIALALHHQGHEARVLLNGHFLDTAHRLGVDAHASGESLGPQVVADHPRYMDPWKGTMIVLKEIMTAHARPDYAALLEHAESFQPDVIVGHQVSFAAPWAAETLGVPFATTAIAPTGWPSIDNPSQFPGMPDRDTYPRFATKLGTMMARWTMSRALDGPLNTIRAELGLPAQRDFLLERCFAGAANLGLWSPAFRPPVSDDPPNSTVAGFPFLPDAPAAPEVDEFLDHFATEGRPAIVVSLGTTVVHLGERIYAAAAEACAAMDRPALLLVGTEAACARLAPLPADVMAYPAAPHGAVFPRAACAIHHGGIGSTAQSLRSGRPAVVIPHAHDQFDNARRCRMLGQSITLPKRRANAGGIRRAIEAALQLTGGAHQIGKRVRREGGPACAAEAIAGLAISSPTVPT